MESNSASGDGGGGGVSTLGALSISSSVFRGNSATQRGGAIFFDNWQAPLVASASLFEGNSCGGCGGGLAVAGASAIALSGGSVSGNAAAGDGGGLCLLGTPQAQSLATCVNQAVVAPTGGSGAPRGSAQACMVVFCEHPPRIGPVTPGETECAREAPAPAREMTCALHGRRYIRHCTWVNHAVRVSELRVEPGGAHRLLGAAAGSAVCGKPYFPDLGGAVGDRHGDGARWPSREAAAPQLEPAQPSQTPRS